MFQKGIFKGVASFPQLSDYVEGEPIVLHILEIKNGREITAKLMEKSFEPGLTGIAKSTGTVQYNLTGCIESNGRLYLHSKEGIELLLEYSSSGNTLVGEYYKNETGPARLILSRI